MTVTEIILLVISAVLFTLSTVAEKIFRVKLKADADKISAGIDSQMFSRNRAMRTVFSLASAFFAALVFVIVIVTGAGHEVQLASVLVMLFVLLV